MVNKNGFIRAFWRRVERYKDDYQKELPEKMPIEFTCAFETASILLRPEPVLYQFKHKETNEGCANFGEWSDWDSCDKKKADEINKYIEAGYPYVIRSLAVIDE